MTPGTDRPLRREFELRRTFNASRDLVFAVWTDPRYVALWWGVDGCTNPRCEIDARVGGAWRIDMQTPGGAVFPNGGTFLEVVTSQRLVYSDIPDPNSPAWSGNAPGVMVHTIEFKDLGPASTEVLITVRAHSEADCERLVVMGMRDGMSQALDRQERLLAALRSGFDPAATMDPVQ